MKISFLRKKGELNMDIFTTLDGRAFTLRPYTGPQPATPETLIGAIAAVTGWNLDLAEPVTDGKGGMTVCFAPSCCVFQGPPNPQKEEYHVFDSVGMALAALGSIKYTLQMWADPIAPDKVPIYFCAAGNQPITVAGARTLPLYEPYHVELLE